MIRRLLLGLVLLIAAVIILPPLWFALFPGELPELPPAGRRVMLASGMGVNVVEAGSGPPIVLSHGLPGSAYDWRVLVPELAKRGHSVYAYDRIGYGRSDPRIGGEFTPDANAADLVGLLEALDLHDATIVGWSYGGATAIQAAHMDPSRMGRLVLVGSVGPGADQEEEPPAILSLLFSRPVLRWMRAVPPLTDGLQAALSDQAFSGQTQPEWWLPTLSANFAQPHTRTTFDEEGAAIATLPDPDGVGGPDPRGIDLPILVIHGDDDRLVPVAQGEALHEYAPNSQLLVVEDGSHMLPVTRADWMAERISSFQEGS